MPGLRQGVDVKPLPRCHSTVEDLDIWLAVIQRWRLRYGAKAMARFDLEVYASDRRDAALMLKRQQTCTLRYRDGCVVAGSGQTPRSWWCLPL